MSEELTFDAFEKEWLTEIRAGAPSTVELGNRFSRKLVTQWLEIAEDSDSPDDICYCDGAGDGGIDIACLQRSDDSDDSADNGDVWYLVQSKYGSAFSGTSTLLNEAQKLIDTLDGKRNNLSSLSAGLVERLQTFRKQCSSKDKLVLVFATQRPLSESERQAVEDIRAMGKNRLGASFETEAISLETIYHRTLDELSHVKKTQARITAHLVPSGEEMLVGSVGLMQLFDFLKSYKSASGDLDLLYEKNVRRFLGNRRKVNKGIEETILKKPERFGLYNNGITIVVEEFQKLPNNIEYELTEPFVVNGCQTTRTIWEVLYKKLEAGGTGLDDELEKWKKNLGKGIVVVKIVKVGTTGEELLTETTRYTNSQNAVSEKDFLALESDFQKWSKNMATKYNVFLEIQRGGWDSQKAYQKQNPSTKSFSEYVNAFDLLKVYGAAWLGEAGISYGKNPPFAPGGTLFHRIVNQDDFGLDDLYAAYRLYKAGNRFKFGRGAEVQQRGQTRHLFYMLATELLKDCLIAADIQITNKNITSGFTKLFMHSDSTALEALLDFSVSIADDYLTPGHEYSIFKEPTFLEKGSDLNSFLKWDQLGKSNQSTPLLLNLVSQYKIAMKGGIGGQPKYRDIVKDIISA
ncbi:AIPR family protein [Paraburkholderia sp. SOS3]|uniref:AIPR family protein n=1 Tax=Paraburkholderia sp. SOS3 TaxID=1926494 RepID=UPI0009473B52|nr:AIPR family protein [Paraburkholderia sp. SOS3]APR34339.1 abortive phage resistance protein [Paraburkholderia sp. SOS3]